MSLPELDRRKKETGVFAHIAETFIGKQGRKAAFGIWGFWVATSLRVADKISAEQWWYVFLTCALLVGFGTIADALVTKLGDAVVTFAGNKIASITHVKTDVTVTTPE